MAITPQNAALLLKKGFRSVLVEHGAGFQAQFPAHDYEAAGATLVNATRVWTDSDIVLKVRPPRLRSTTLSPNNFISGFRQGGVIISMLQPNSDRYKNVIDTYQSKGLTSFAMDMIPRITRAQTFDVLSSMANIAGYKAVLEASNAFGRYMTGQTTAAGKVPPCKVLVIGAGVAGLSAIATARRMGAIVRCFDTRAATKEQIQSLGAEALTVDLQEDGSGGGGYSQSDVEGVPRSGDATLRPAMRGCGHRDYDRADPRPTSTAAYHRGDGGEHEAGQCHCRPRRGEWRQLRAHCPRSIHLS